MYVPSPMVTVLPKAQVRGGSTQTPSPTAPKIRGSISLRFSHWEGCIWLNSKHSPRAFFCASIASLVSVQREVRAFRKSAAGGRTVERDRWVYIRFVRTEKEQGTVSDFLFGGAAGGGWYSVLTVRIRAARRYVAHRNIIIDVWMQCEQRQPSLHHRMTGF